MGAEAKVTKGEEPVVTIQGITGPIEEESTVSDTEADEMEEHLRGLSCTGGSPDGAGPAG